MNRKLRTLLATSALWAAVQPALAQEDPTAKAIALSALQATQQQSHKIACLSRVGNQGGAKTSASYVYGSSSFNAVTYRTHHYSFGCTNPVVTICNSYMLYSGEQNGPNALLVHAALTWGASPAASESNIAPVHFPGETSAGVTLQPGQCIDSNPISVTLPAGYSVYTQVYVQGSASPYQWPVGALASDSNISPNLYEGWNGGSGTTAGSDQSQASAPASITANYYSPQFDVAAVTGTPLNKNLKYILIEGDSTTAGVDDQPYVGTVNGQAQTGLQSFMERGVAYNYAWIRSTQSGDTVQDANASQNWRYAYAFPHVTDVYTELGTNDLFVVGGSGLSDANGLSLSAMQAAWITHWLGFSNRHVKVWQATILPRPACSAAGCTTTADQVLQTTYNNPESVREAANAWLRCGAPMNLTWDSAAHNYVTGATAQACGTSGAAIAGQTGHPLSGIIDTAAAVEDPNNPGKWKVASATGDSVSWSVRGAGTATCTTSGSNDVTDTSGTIHFTSADVGKGIYLNNNGTQFTAVIQLVLSANEVQVVGAAPAGLTNVNCAMGQIVWNDGTHPLTWSHAVLLAPVVAAVTP